MKKQTRCAWADTQEIFHKYHDEEWGVPVHNDRLLFEMINLEGAQAGLSWLTILRKRAGYKKAFENFDAAKIIKNVPRKKAALMKNQGIVRNRLKIAAVVANAKAYLEVKKEFGTFDKYIWSFTEGKILKNKGLKKHGGLAISEAMSKDLKKRGFKFIGATICYAFMQAVGIINDHDTTCFRN